MTFDLAEQIRRATSAYLALEGIAIPKSLLKPTEGKCVECGYMTEDRDDGDWICEGCRGILIRQTQEDERLDDPRHVPYRNLGRR